MADLFKLLKVLFFKDCTKLACLLELENGSCKTIL
jgi:hypothetical protein